jgi:predicted pyridoxine 5'-phosphate oxidase superfamily flavin-nucleotide-binding protein
MVMMSDTLIALLNEWHSVPVATIGADGMPNVAAKSVMVQDPETIVWGELYFMQTYENLMRHPVASLSVWEWAPPFTAYQVKGRVAIHKDDEVTAALDRSVWTGHTGEFAGRIEGMAAVVLTAEAIYDQTPRFEGAGERIA